MSLHSCFKQQRFAFTLLLSFVAVSAWALNSRQGEAELYPLLHCQALIESYRVQEDKVFVNSELTIKNNKLTSSSRLVSFGLTEAKASDIKDEYYKECLKQVSTSF